MKLIIAFCDDMLPLSLLNREHKNNMLNSHLSWGDIQKKKQMKMYVKHGQLDLRLANARTIFRLVWSKKLLSATGRAVDGAV